MRALSRLKLSVAGPKAAKLHGYIVEINIFFIDTLASDKLRVKFYLECLNFECAPSGWRGENHATCPRKRARVG